MVSMDRHERVVTLELAVRRADGLHEVAVVVVLDQVGDRLGVGLGGEDVPLLREPSTQLAVVLDDPVEDDGELLDLLRCEGVGILLRHAAVGGPARVAEPGRRRRRCRAGTLPQVLEVPDRARVGEAVRLEQRDPGGVIAPVLEALEAVQQEGLAFTRPDVSDDPAHLASFRPDAQCPGGCARFAGPLSDAGLLPDEIGDASTELRGLLCALGLGEHPYERLGPGGPHEHASAAVELGVEAFDLLDDAPGNLEARERHVLLRLGIARHDRDRFGERAAVERSAEREGSRQPVTGDMSVEHDEVAGLLAPEDSATPGGAPRARSGRRRPSSRRARRAPP